MTVGLPGSGIGGFFYILSALWMPFNELYRAIRRPDEPRRWRLAFTQFFIASTIVVTLTLVGWAWGSAIAPRLAIFNGRDVPTILGISALAITLGVLATVLSSVQLLRLAVGRKPRRNAVGIPLPHPLTPPAPQPTRSERIEEAVGS
jgi:hypothetical protein